jgi:hypothetical protein
LLFSLLLSLGCAQPCPDAFLPPGEVLARHNANANAVPRLWARAKIAVTLVDDKGRQFTWGSTSPLASPNGLLLLFKDPNGSGGHDFVLIGREAAGVELFRLGNDNERGVYYFWYSFGERAGAWFGLTRLAGGPGVEALPIDPTQLVSLLAIVPLPVEPNALPATVVTMQDTPGRCAYVATHVGAQAVTGNVLFKRRMYFHWATQEPPRAYRVDILDPAGRTALTADLADWKPIDVSALGEPPKTAPVMPTRLDIAATPVDTRRGASVRRIQLVLSEVTAGEKAMRSATRFRPPPGVAATQVDRSLVQPPTTDRGAK